MTGALGELAAGTLAAAAIVGGIEYGLPYFGIGARETSNFTKPSTLTGLARAYEWAKGDMGNTPAWQQFQNEPQKFINKPYWTDRDSYGDYAAEVLTDMINGQPNSIYEMDIDTMKNAVRAFRNGDGSKYKKVKNELYTPITGNIPVTYTDDPPVFNVNTTDIEQTRKDMLALNNLIYAYQNFGSPGQQRAANGILNDELLPTPMTKELRKIYETNKDKLAAYDFSGLNLPPEEVPRLLEYLQSKTRKKTVLDPATASSSKNSAKPQNVIPVDGYSTRLQEKLQQKRGVSK